MKSVLLFLLSSLAFAGTFSVTVAGTTNTQAVLSWSHLGDCTVQASESASLSPLVHDVDPALFSGSNSTMRPEALNSGSSHIFVVGKRTSEVAADSLSYSRALQNTTLHYFSITCGSDTGTGTFTTKNIPFASNWADSFQPGATPGSWAHPSFQNDRSKTYIDQFTGTLIKPLSQPSDITVSPNTPSNSSGGFHEFCSAILSTNGFYHCLIPNDYAPYLYGINPADGSARFLGALYYFGQSYGLQEGVHGCLTGSSGGNAMWDDVNANIVYCGSFATSGDVVAVAVTYTGNDVPVTSGQVGGFPPPASLTVSVLTPAPNTMSALIAAAQPETSGFNCALDSYQGGLFSITCRRGEQDTYGWYGAYSLGNKLPLGSGGTGHIVGLVSTWSLPSSRWCTEHTYEYMGNTSTLSLGTQSPKGGGTGAGPYQMVFSADVPNASPGDHTPVTVTSSYIWGTPPAGYQTGEPVSPELDHFLMTYQVGDVFTTASGEFMQVFSKTDSQHLTVTRGIGSGVGLPVTAHSSGDSMSAWCNANLTDPTTLPYMWWNPLTSPDASSNYGANFGGHPVTRGNDRVDGGWFFRTTAISNPANWGIYNTQTISPSPMFAGASLPADGNYFEKHPSEPDSAPGWFLDVSPLIGGNIDQTQDDTSTVNVTGDLWQFKYNGVDSANGLQRKQAATYAVTGNAGGTASVLTDVSGPSCVLDGTSAHAYQYAVPNANNECFTGSVAGNIYFNIPASIFPVGSRYCKGADQGAFYSICIGKVPAIGFSVLQGKIQTDTTGQSLRALSKAFMEPHYTVTGNTKPLSDGSWSIYLNILSGSQGAFLLKIPPLGSSDGVDRTTFVNAVLNLTPPAGLGIATAKVYFGYSEQGDASQYYCTSRREACVAVASTVTPSNPFSYSQTDSYSPAACASSCTITVPVLPMHTAYLKVSYLNGSNVEVSSSLGIASESSVQLIGAGSPSTVQTVISGRVTISGSATIH